MCKNSTSHHRSCAADRIQGREGPELSHKTADSSYGSYAPSFSEYSTGPIRTDSQIASSSMAIGPPRDISRAARPSCGNKHLPRRWEHGEVCQ